MRKLGLLVGAFVIGTTAACAHAPIKTAAAPSPGYYLGGGSASQSPSASSEAASLGYYLLGRRLW
jgi:hypothetical protein